MAEDVLEWLTGAPAGKHCIEMGEGALGGGFVQDFGELAPERSAGLFAQPPCLGPTANH